MRNTEKTHDGIPRKPHQAHNNAQYCRRHYRAGGDSQRIEDARRKCLPQRIIAGIRDQLIADLKARAIHQKMETAFDIFRCKIGFNIGSEHCNESNEKKDQCRLKRKFTPAANLLAQNPSIIPGNDAEALSRKHNFRDRKYEEGSRQPNCPEPFVRFLKEKRPSNQRIGMAYMRPPSVQRRFIPRGRLSGLVGPKYFVQDSP